MDGDTSSAMQLATPAGPGRFPFDEAEKVALVKHINWCLADDAEVPAGTRQLATDFWLLTTVYCLLATYN